MAVKMLITIKIIDHSKNLIAFYAFA